MIKTERKVDAMRQAEILMEACFAVEEIELEHMRLESEAAEARATSLRARKQGGKKEDRWITEKDIIHAESVADWMRNAYEKEELRIHGEVEEVDESDQQVNKRLSMYAGDDNPDDFRGPGNSR